MAHFIFATSNHYVQQLSNMTSLQAMPNTGQHKIKTKVHLGKCKKENNIITAQKTPHGA